MSKQDTSKIVELDLLGMSEKKDSTSQLHKFFHRQGSFREIQNAFTKMNPEMLKSMMSSGMVNHVDSSGTTKEYFDNLIATQKSVSVPCTPSADQSMFPALPVYSPIFRHTHEDSEETSELTIFYNGSVSVFDLSSDKAENILKLASSAEHDMDQRCRIKGLNIRPWLEEFHLKDSYRDVRRGSYGAPIIKNPRVLTSRSQRLKLL